MINWMLWATGFAALILVSALALERVASYFRAPRRHIWMVAMVAAAIVPPLLATRQRSVTAAPATVIHKDVAPAHSAGPVSVYDATINARTAPQSRSVAEGSVSEHFPDRWALYAWLTASLLLAGFFARTIFTMRAQSTAWKEMQLETYRALVSPNAGPAVIGFARPRIVIPEWALAIDRSARELVLRHEMEHIRAFDPRTLFAAGVLLVAFPWNVALWMIVRQLRRAMELDCDARVIRATGDAAEYGRMLLAVGERFTASLPLAAALSEPRPLLEQRIHAMTTPSPRRPLRAAVPFIVLASLAMIAATRAPRPAPLPPIVFARASEPQAAPTRTQPQSSTAITSKAVAESVTSVRPVVTRIDRDRVRRDSAILSPITPSLGREEVIALARSHFPLIASGASSAKFLVIVLDAAEQYVGGFPANAGVTVQIQGDTLTATQRRSPSSAARSAGASTAGAGRAGRAGRGGGATGLAPMSGISSRNNTNARYVEMFGMTSAIGSDGVRRSGPMNIDAGLSPIAPNSAESGIDGILARNVVHVDQFRVTTEDQFGSPLTILAVHLNNNPASIGTQVSGAASGPVTIQVRAGSLSFDRADTGQVPEKKKAKVKQLVIVPAPAPPVYTMKACFDIAANGEAKLLDYAVRSRDTAFNRKVLESLPKYTFTPATLNGVAVRDTVCVTGPVGTRGSRVARKVSP